MRVRVGGGRERERSELVRRRRRGREKGRLPASELEHGRRRDDGGRDADRQREGGGGVGLDVGKGQAECQRADRKVQRIEADVPSADRIVQLGVPREDLRVEPSAQQEREGLRAVAARQPGGEPRDEVPLLLLTGGEDVVVELLGEEEGGNQVPTRRCAHEGRCSAGRRDRNSRKGGGSLGRGLFGSGAPWSRGCGRLRASGNARDADQASQENRDREPSHHGDRLPAALYHTSAGVYQAFPGARAWSATGATGARDSSAEGPAARRRGRGPIRPLRPAYSPCVERRRRPADDMWRSQAARYRRRALAHRPVVGDSRSRRRAASMSAATWCLRASTPGNFISARMRERKSMVRLRP